MNAILFASLLAIVGMEDAPEATTTVSPPRARRIEAPVPPPLRLQGKPSPRTTVIIASSSLESTPGPEDATAIWELTLADAIRVGLANSEGVRIVSLHAPVVEGFEPTKPTCRDISVGSPTSIARRSDMPLVRFKAEVMAHVRSVEQLYWTLYQQHVNLWAREKFMEKTKDLLVKVSDDLAKGRGVASDVAEVQQRLEQLRLDMITATSDVITTERQLRNLLGLPASDSRKILPVSSPVESLVKPNWDECHSTMLTLQPDIIQQRAVVIAAVIKVMSVQGGQLLGELFNLTEPNATATVQTRVARYTLLKQKAYLKQMVHQNSHSLARFFLEVDASYKQLQAAARLRIAAEQRLEAQKAFYEERRITVDRYLDAITQCASAFAMESQYKATYNISLAALEEAKGTLLTYDNITVEETETVVAPSKDATAQPVASKLEAPRPARKNWRSVDSNVRLAKAEGNEADHGATAKPEKSSSSQAKPSPAPTPKTVKFDVMIGDAKPLRIRGSFTISSDDNTPSISLPDASHP